MEPEDLLLHLQVPAACPYPEPDQSSPCPLIPFHEDPFYVFCTVRCEKKNNVDQRHATLLNLI
jgi:hypothetical protein